MTLRNVLHFKLCAKIILNRFIIPEQLCEIKLAFFNKLLPLHRDYEYCRDKVGQKMQIFWYSGLLCLIPTQILLIF